MIAEHTTPTRPVLVLGELRVIEIQRDVDGENPVVILECPLLNGAKRRFHISLEMAGRPSAVAAYLRSEDVVVLPPAPRLQEILAAASSDPSLLVHVSRWTGWQGKGFVLEEQVIGPNKRKISFVDEEYRKIVWQRPTAAEWSEAFGPLVVQSKALVTLVSAAFAAPLLKLTGRAGFPLLHVIGGSAGERSVALRTAVAVCNRANVDELLPLGTDLDAHHDQLRTRFDQVGGYVPSPDHDVARLRKAFEGTAACLLAGRLSRKPDAGLVRMIGVAADLGTAAEGMIPDRSAICTVPLHRTKGLLDRKRSKRASSAPGDLYEQLNRAINDTAGGAFPAFLQGLCNDRDAVSKIEKYMESFLARMAPKSGREGCLPDAFAMIYAAGRLAADYDVVPWDKKDVFASVAAIYRRSIRASSSVEEVAERALETLDGKRRDSLVFPQVDQGQRVPKSARGSLWGIRRKVGGHRAVCLLADRLDRLIPVDLQAPVKAIWVGQGILLTRKNDPEHLTQQIAVQGLTPARPRFFCFSAAQLAKIGKLKRSSE